MPPPREMCPLSFWAVSWGPPFPRASWDLIPFSTQHRSGQPWPPRVTQGHEAASPGLPREAFKGQSGGTVNMDWGRGSVVFLSSPGSVPRADLANYTDRRGGGGGRDGQGGLKAQGGQGCIPPEAPGEGPSRPFRLRGPQVFLGCGRTPQSPLSSHGLLCPLCVCLLSSPGPGHRSLDLGPPDKPGAALHPKIVNLHLRRPFSR